MTDQTPALPIWDELSDLDKGAVLLHLHKRDVEGAEYAVDNYPAEFFDHPALVTMGEEEASEFAATVAGGEVEEVGDRIGWPEYQRLYDLALDADRARVTAEIEARNA